MNKEIVLSYQTFSSIDELPEEDKELLGFALKSADNAYAPYSKFKVGAALRLIDGTIVSGNNQENAAYPSGLCAERVALFSASANFPEVTISSIAIVAHPHSQPLQGSFSPCGACRQVLAEYQNLQQKAITIILQDQQGEILKLASVDTLLPFAFEAKGLRMG